MSTLLKLAAKVVIVVFIGGFIGATFVRSAPGYGVTEEDLDTRLSGQSQLALRHAHEDTSSLASFYVHYWAKLLHGDFGFSNAMGEPVRRLIADRFPETLKSVGLGLAIGWTAALSLAILTVTTRSAFADVGANLLASIAVCTPAAVLALI